MTEEEFFQRLAMLEKSAEIATAAAEAMQAKRAELDRALAEQKAQVRSLDAVVQKLTTLEVRAGSAPQGNDARLDAVLAELHVSRWTASQNRLLRALMVLAAGFAAGTIASLWFLKPRIEDIQWQATNAQTAIYAVWRETTPEGKKAKAEEAKKATKPKE